MRIACNHRLFTNRIFLAKISSILLFYFLSVSFIAKGNQSNGEAVLSEIESKANQILQNEKKVGELNQQYIQTYTYEQEKLKRLKKELSDLLSEKGLVLEDYRQGYFCSGCGKSRSQFAPGETFPHAGQKIVPATNEQIAAKEKEYDDKISTKQEEVKQFEFSENEFTRKRADISHQMDDLKALDDKIRADIVNLSASYKAKVIEEGKSKMKPFIDRLMYLVANQHYLEDRIDIFNTRISDLNSEEAEAVIKIVEKVRLQNEEDKNKLESEINRLKTDLKKTETEYSTRKYDLEILNKNLGSEILRIKKLLLAKKDLSIDERSKLETQQADLESKVKINENELTARKLKYDEDVQAISNEIKLRNDKIWDLTVNLDSRQQEAKNILMETYKTKREILNQAKAARENSLRDNAREIENKIAEDDQEMTEFYTILETERVRLVTACGSANCGCSGYDSKSEMWGNWNSAKACVNEMDTKKHLEVYYGCEEETPIYLNYYRGMQNGMSPGDLEVLKRATTRTRYDAILKTIK